VPNVIHHTAICVADMDASLRFYRDGLGMEQTVEGTFDGPWRQLFGGPADRLRMVMLGDPESPRAGTLELLEYDGGAVEPAPPPAARTGFTLVSLYCDVDASLERLAALGFPDHERVEIDTPHGSLVMGSVRDPDGTLIELIDAAVGSQVTG
jgi:catechol 2,3-dioxygenase-like lactoylglutathione lyase family enzyme